MLRLARLLRAVRVGAKLRNEAASAEQQKLLKQYDQNFNEKGTVITSAKGTVITSAKRTSIVGSMKTAKL